jgi:hypothetical protein
MLELQSQSQIYTLSWFLMQFYEHEMQPAQAEDHFGS